MRRALSPAKRYEALAECGPSWLTKTYPVRRRLLYARRVYRALDVRDEGLRGRSDADVFAYAQERDASLITADKGFTNVLSFPLGTHAGLIVLRIPNELPTIEVNRQLLRALAGLEGEELQGLLVIVEVGRTRIRRVPSTNR